MKKITLFCSCLCLLLMGALFSCNNIAPKTEEEIRKEKLEESMENLKESLEEVGEDLKMNLEGTGEDLKEAGEELGESLGNALGELGESLKDIKLTKDGEEVETVSFREIKKVMPSTLVGLDRTETSGETNGALGIKVSTAEAIYEGDDDQKIELSITDTGGAGLAIMGMATWSKVEVDRENKHEIEYTTTIEGYKAFVSYKKKRKKGSISLIVDDRYVVNLEGKGLDLDDLEKAIKKLGVKKYARKLG